MEQLQQEVQPPGTATAAQAVTHPGRQSAQHSSCKTEAGMEAGTEAEQHSGGGGAEPGAEAMTSAAEHCLRIVARLQTLPMPDGCNSYLQRCVALRQVLRQP